MAPGRNSYRIANAAFDARARRLARPEDRRVPFMWGLTAGVILGWGLVAIVADFFWRLL